MSCLRRQQRRLDRLEIAHFADQNDVGVLTQCAPQRIRKRARVDGNFPLIHDRLVVAMEILDGVLDRHDVARTGRVDVVDHRGERRALAAAGGSGDQHEAALFLSDPLEHRRQPQLVDRLDARRDHAQHHADRASLLEHVAAEPSQSRHAVRQVYFLALAELLHMVGGEEHAGHRFGVVAIEPLGLGRHHQHAVDAHHRVAADFEMDVGRSAGDRDFEQFVQFHGIRVCSRSTSSRRLGIRRRRPPEAVRRGRRRSASCADRASRR